VASYTQHAKTQSQRRGISKEHSELVIAYGDTHKSTSHCQIFRINRNELKELQHDNVGLWNSFRDRMRALMVVSDNDTVVTAKHQHINKRLHKKITLNDRRS
jgi:hypothetical protein